MSSTAAEYDLTEADSDSWAAEVRRLAAERDAVILAHNYQAPLIQDVADHVGDSLALSRLAAASTARTIVFAGVYFMAETAKILAPDRTVLIPDPRAGCSLADSITAAAAAGLEGRAPGRGRRRLREHQRRGQGRGGRLLHLGQRGGDRRRASRPTGRSCSCPTSSSARTSAGSPAATTCTSGWASATCTRASARPTCATRRRPSPDAELFVHPECGCGTAALWQAGAGDLPAERTRVLSTGGMLAAARDDHGHGGAGGHRDRHAAPAAQGQPGRALGAGQPARGVPVHEDDHARRRCCAACATGVTEVHVDPDVAEPGPPGRGGDDRRSARRRRPANERAASPRACRRSGRPGSGRPMSSSSGSGAAGISAALAAARRGRRVLLITKDGWAAARRRWRRAAWRRPSAPATTRASTQRDTLAAGRRAVRPAAVAALAARGAGRDRPG